MKVMCFSILLGIFNLFLIYFICYDIIVQEALQKAKAGTNPKPEELYSEIYATEDGKSEPVPFIRMPDYTKSIINN